MRPKSHSSNLLLLEALHLQMMQGEHPYIGECLWTFQLHDLKEDIPDF